MTTRNYFVRLYTQYDGEIDSEQIIGGAVEAAIKTLVNRCKFANGDKIMIEMEEDE